MTPAQPVYYPSCVVNLRLRFDERMVFNAEGAAAFAFDQDEMLKRTQGPRAFTDIPLFMQNAENDKLSYVNGRIPTRASIELPAYRDSGKFSLTFDYRDLPIDPRLLRACGVEIYLDSVAGENFSSGVLATAPPNGERASVITKRGRSSMLTQSPENLALVGTVDSWRVEHTANGSTVSMEGRDNRAVLLEQIIVPELLPTIPLKDNIIDVVAYIVGKQPFGQQMLVSGPDAAEWPKGVIPSPVSQDVALSLGNSAQTRVRRGAQGKDPRVSAGAQPDKLNVWDLITKLCTLVGAVPYFRNVPAAPGKKSVLWVAPARNLYAQLGAGTRTQVNGVVGKASPTPFQRGGLRDVGESEPLAVRRLVFGRNVETLNYERKFNGFVPRTVEVVSLDTSSEARGEDKLLIVRWPADPQPQVPQVRRRGNTVTTAKNIKEAQVSQVGPGGQVANKGLVRFSVPGIRDKARLLQIAQDIYEELGRGEQGGSVKTRDLASFGAGNEDPDLLRLRPGDAMELLVDASAFSTRYPIRSPANDQARAPDAIEFLNDLTKRLGDDELALAITATSRNLVANLQNYFRVSNVKFDWDVRSGVSVSFDFANYIEARNAVTPIPKDAGRTEYSTNTGRVTPARGIR